MQEDQTMLTYWDVMITLSQEFLQLQCRRQELKHTHDQQATNNYYLGIRESFLCDGYYDLSIERCRLVVSEPMVSK